VVASGAVVDVASLQARREARYVAGFTAMFGHAPTPADREIAGVDIGQDEDEAPPIRTPAALQATATRIHARGRVTQTSVVAYVVTYRGHALLDTLRRGERETAAFLTTRRCRRPGYRVEPVAAVLDRADGTDAWSLVLETALVPTGSSVVQSLRRPPTFCLICTDHPAGVPGWVCTRCNHLGALLWARESADPHKLVTLRTLVHALGVARQQPVVPFGSCLARSA
jgi:hypothetical protein